MGDKARKRAALSPLENAVMQVIWNDQPLTAEDVRLRLEGKHDLKDSTIRTVLRRLEEKGYAEHDVEGRTYVYRAKVEQTNVASSAVRGIVEKFCSGSIENLLVGLVDDKLISPERLKQLAEEIAKAKEQSGKSRRK
jgi:predicted transcriptional regulator